MKKPKCRRWGIYLGLAVAVLWGGCAPAQKQPFDRLRVSFTRVIPEISALPSAPPTETLPRTSPETTQPVSRPAGVEKPTVSPTPDEGEPTKVAMAQPAPAETASATPAEKTLAAPGELAEFPGLEGMYRDWRAAVSQATALSQNPLPASITSAVMLKKGIYEIAQTIQVEESGSLFIEPGVTLNFHDSSLICLGYLDAVGTPQEKILFQGDARWGNVTLWGEKARGLLRHCKFEGGVGQAMSVDPDGNYELGEGDLFFGGALLFGHGALGKVWQCEISHVQGLGSIACLQSQVEIRQNKISKSNQGIFCGSTSRAQIIENECTGHTHTGILCDEQSQPLLKKNQCSYNKLAGILCQGNTKAIVEENLCEQNGMGGHAGVSQTDGVGILCFDKTTSVIRNNVCQSNRNGGISITGQSQALVEGNRCENNPAYGIAILETACPVVRKNVCRGSRNTGIGVSTQNTPLLEENTCEQNGYGIYVDWKNGSRPQIKENNKLEGNAKGPIFYDGR